MNVRAVSIAVRRTLAALTFTDTTRVNVKTATSGMECNAEVCYSKDMQVVIALV